MLLMETEEELQESIITCFEILITWLDASFCADWPAMSVSLFIKIAVIPVTESVMSRSNRIAITVVMPFIKSRYNITKARSVSAAASAIVIPAA